jgi:predicted metalloprotease with PDZ domain
MRDPMPYRRRWCLLFAVFTVSGFAQTSLRYELSFPNAVHHEAEVRATFSGVRTPILEIVMSRSSPGRYALHEFAKNVYNVRATDANGAELPISRPSPYGWTVATNGSNQVVFDYTVFGDRGDGTYDQIDETHAHLNMPATLAWAVGFENAPATLKFDLPDRNWKIATQLLPGQNSAWNAPNLEWLMDSPVEISNHDFPEWKIENATFRLSLHHEGTDGQAAAYAKMCEAVVLEEEGVFGAFPKYDGGTYTFLVDYLPYVSGDGMEHRDSTVISGATKLTNDSASRLIGTVSHEFFHSWNVKRIRPKSLEPFNFERADMSGELWFAEGFTNYYGILVLKRVGLEPLDQFARTMGYAVNAVLTDPGRKVFNVVDMSRLAPFVDAARSIDPTNMGNNFISYYTYGQALAFGIDLLMRQQYPGKSLDDWIGTMWREHPDIDKPYTLDDLQKALGDTVNDAGFARQVFEHHILGKEPMEYGDLVGAAGLVLRKAHAGQAWVGAIRSLNFSDKGAEVSDYTERGSPLYNAGIDKGDRIAEWDGKSLKTQPDFEKWIDTHKPGDSITVKVARRDGSHDVQLTFAENPAAELVTFETAGKALTPEITAFRQSWLTSKSLHPLPAIDKIP